jgi:hypothetical protein
MVPLSVLDLSPITEGGDAGQALRNSLDLARWREVLAGYHVACHHVACHLREVQTRAFSQAAGVHA